MHSNNFPKYELIVLSIRRHFRETFAASSVFIHRADDIANLGLTGGKVANKSHSD